MKALPLILVAQTLADMARIEAKEAFGRLAKNADALGRHRPMFQAARSFLEQGLRPVPMKPHQKRPLISWREYQDRSPTLAEITRWWFEHPDAWVGLVTGAGSRLIVVDVDPRNGGSLDGLDIPPGAPIVRTPSGGTHIWLAHPGTGRIASRTIRPGVDVKGDGGIAISPPSTGYVWQTTNGGSLPVAPDWLLAEPERRGDHRERDDWFTTTFNEATPEGQRNETAARMAGYLLRRGLSSDATLTILQGWTERCDPPFPAQELEGVVASIARKHGASKAHKQRLTLHAPSELTAPDMQHCIDGLVLSATLNLLTGVDKSGKTLLALEMARSIQTGKPFLGHFPVRQGQVIALLMDDPPGLVKERIVQKMQLADDGIRLATHMDVPEDGRDILADLADEAVASRPALIIVDALYVLLYGNDDQLFSPGGMQRIIRKLDRIAEESGAAVLLIHHPPKKDPRGAAGSYVISAGSKSKLNLVKGDKNRRTLYLEGKFKAEASYHLELQPEETWAEAVWAFMGDAQDWASVELEHNVMKMVKEKSGLLTTKEVAERTGRRESEVAKILEHHEADKVLCRANDPEHSGRGAPRKVWFWVPSDKRQPGDLDSDEYRAGEDQDE